MTGEKRSITLPVQIGHGKDTHTHTHKTQATMMDDPAILSNTSIYSSFYNAVKTATHNMLNGIFRFL